MGQEESRGEVGNVLFLDLECLVYNNSLCRMFVLHVPFHLCVVFHFKKV